MQGTFGKLSSISLPISSPVSLHAAKCAAKKTTTLPSTRTTISIMTDAAGAIAQE
jgi:hypothetical protein